MGRSVSPIARFPAFSPCAKSFAAYGFQSLSNSVILLDLTGIIAFDVFREQKCRGLVAWRRLGRSIDPEPN